MSAIIRMYLNFKLLILKTIFIFTIHFAIKLFLNCKFKGRKNYKVIKLQSNSDNKMYDIAE